MASTLIVSVEPAALDLQGGSEATARVTVENHSQFVGQYQLTIATVDASWCTFDPDQLGVFPSSSDNATLRLRLPAYVAPATYPVIVRAINQNDASDEGRALLKVNVRATAGAPPPPPPQVPESRRAPPSRVVETIAPFVGAAALRSASPGAGQLEFAADRDSLSVLPGASQTLNLLVRNSGGTLLYVELGAQGLPATWLTLTPTAAELAPGQAAGARLTLTPPSDAPTGNYPITLVANDRDNPANTVPLSLVVEIGEAGGLLVTLNPPQADGQASAEFTVRVTQSGSSAVNVALQASDEEGACAYTFNPATIFVPPHGEATSKLTVRASKGLVGIDARTFPFTVTATATEGTAAASTTQGRFTQRAAPPIALSLNPTEQSAPDQATYAVRVGNASQIATTVKLSASEDGGALRFQFNTASLVVPPNGAAQSDLTVTPTHLSDEPGQLIHNFTVRAEPSGELLSAAQVAGKFIQTAVQLPSLALTPTSQSAAGGANYTVQVTNPHTAWLDVELRAYDAANLVTLQLTPSLLHLLPGGQARAKLSVRPTTKLLAGEERRPNEFTVEARVPGVEHGTGAQGTLVQVPGLNIGKYVLWMLTLVLIVMLCGGAAFVVQRLTGSLTGIVSPVQTLIASAPTAIPLTPFATFTPTPTTTPTPIPPTTTPVLAPFAVTGVTAKVSPASANACPATFNFSAEISVNRAGAVTYVWEFSNGTSTTPQTLNFAGPGKQTVSTNAAFNVNGNAGGHVKVTSPPTPDSNQATVALNCPAAPTAKPPTPTPTPTLPPAVVTHATGSLNILQTFLADLDEGLIINNITSDIFFHAVSATERYVEPTNGARIAKVGTTSVGKAGCAAAALSTTRINVNDLPAGT
ncbi:MAG: NEW3 domain-containing protein, partial [Chloroflexota bacterium]